MIGYHFPPDASVGAVRPAKFAKYLNRLGWAPYILTVNERHVPARDDRRLEDVAHLPIVRTSRWPTILESALAVKRSLTQSKGGSQTAASIPVASDGSGSRLWRRVRRTLNSLLELPDEHVGWLIPAVWAAYRLVRAHGIQVVVTSSPPWTTAVVGLLLTYIAPIRLVTDLRDPWVTPYDEDAWFHALPQVVDSRSAAGDRIRRWLEARVVHRSARVITTTERHAVALRRRYPALADDRIAVIPNGYDAEDLDALPPAPARKAFTIAYLGSFYIDRSPRQLFEAVGELIREGRLSASELEINIVGNVQSTRDGSLDDLVRSSRLGGCVRVEGPVSYAESLSRMMRADVLLLFQPQPYCSVPAKTFEYLAMRKRILCFANDGATADLINQTGAGVVVPPDDVSAIKAAVTRLYEEFKAGRPGAYRSDISVFERSALSQRLSGVLGELV